MIAARECMRERKRRSNEMAMIQEEERGGRGGRGGH